MFYEYQNLYQMFRLVCYWAAGTLGSWLTAQLPTGTLENPVQRLGCQVVPPSATLSPCLGTICFPRAFNVPLPLASA